MDAIERLVFTAAAAIIQLLPTSHRQVLGVIRAMHTIDFASVCFWWGQIAAEKCLCYTKCRCKVSLQN